MNPGGRTCVYPLSMIGNTARSPRAFGRAAALLGVALLVVGAAVSSPAFAQKKKATAAAKPATAAPVPPSLPAALSFADELAGRRLLYAARDAYRNAPGVRFRVVWRRVDRGGGITRGTETVSAGLAARRLAITTETAGSAPGKPQSVRRAIAANGTLLATRFEEKGKTANPAREFVRLPLAPDDPLPRALALVQFAPVSEASALLLDPDWTVRGTTYRPASAPNEVIAVETPSGRAGIARVRRYVLAPKTRLLLRFEEWSATPQDRALAARQNRRGGGKAAAAARSGGTYRREEYAAQASVAAAATLPASLFSQALPPGYAEKPLPSVDLPPVEPGPQAEMDAQTQAVMARWTRAHERFLSYYTEADVALRAETKTADARPLPERWKNQQLRYTAWVRRPGRARLTMTEGGAAAETRAVSDGETVAVRNSAWGRSRTARLDDPATLGLRVLQVGWRDRGQVFDWLLLGPRALVRDSDTVVYRGEQVVNGEPVQALEFNQTVRGRAGRRNRNEAENTITTTFYLGRDGLPRQSQRRSSTEVEGAFTRDEPPNLIITAVYRVTRVDVAPPPGIFVLPEGARR